MKNVGVNAHRLPREPEEKRFAQAWEDQNEQGKTLAYILDGADQQHPPALSDRDRQVAATVVQWLGSHVGQCFLRDLGYVRVPSREWKLDAVEIEYMKQNNAINAIKHARERLGIGLKEAKDFVEKEWAKR